MTSPPAAELARVTEVLGRAVGESSRALDPALWRRTVRDLPGPLHLRWQWATAAMTVLLARRLGADAGTDPGVPGAPDPTIDLGDQAAAVLRAYTNHGSEGLHALTGELDPYQGQAITTALLVTLVSTHQHEDEAAREAWAAAVLADAQPLPPTGLYLIGRGLLGVRALWGWTWTLGLLVGPAIAVFFLVPGSVPSRVGWAVVALAGTFIAGRLIYRSLTGTSQKVVHQ